MLLGLSTCWELQSCFDCCFIYWSINNKLILVFGKLFITVSQDNKTEVHTNILIKITKLVGIKFKPCLEDFESIIFKPCIDPDVPQVRAKIVSSKARNSIIDISDKLSNCMMRLGRAWKRTKPPFFKSLVMAVYTLSTLLMFLWWGEPC